MKITLPKLLLVIGIVGIGVVLVETFGSHGSKGRFCPYSLRFQRCEYSLLSFGRENWRDETNEVLEYLKSSGSVVPTSESPMRWDSVYHFNTRWRDGMGRPYDLLRRNRKRMIEWSEKHPDLAGIVWKEGFRLGRSEDSASVSLGYYLLGNACLDAESAKELKSFLLRLDEEYEPSLFDRDILHQLEEQSKEVRATAMLNLEDKFLFFPTKYPLGDWNPVGLEFEDAFFTAADGVKLHGWFCPCKDARAVVLHAHGNAGHLAHRAALMNYYQQRLRVTSFIFDYRGYGRSEGTPSVAGILDDARAARTWLAKRAGVKESQIVLTGQSLGGAVAVDLAADGGARGLVLESTFSSLKDMAAHHYPQLAWLASPKKLNSAVRIKDYRGPLLMMHGDADDIIPYELGRKLFDAANEPKKWVRIPGGGHNDSAPPAYLEKLDAFIKSLPL
jgi:uncharacterized protein